MNDMFFYAETNEMVVWRYTWNSCYKTKFFEEKHEVVATKKIRFYEGTNEIFVYGGKKIRHLHKCEYHDFMDKNEVHVYVMLIIGMNSLLSMRINELITARQMANLIILTKSRNRLLKKKKIISWESFT